MKIVESHRLKSSKVTEENFQRVLKDSGDMRSLITTGCLALAHSQVDDVDPLAFFVTADGNIIINPVITRHVNYTVESPEGCMTFPTASGIRHKRYHKITVEYQTLDEIAGKLCLSQVRQLTLTGKQSFVFQHEIDHINAIYCYD